MDNKQFIRDYQLILGDIQKPDEAIFIGYNSQTGEDSSLQMSFDITKKADTKRSGGNSCVIEIYNLKEDTLKRLQDTKLLGFYFKAGYRPIGAKLLLSGQVVQVSTKKVNTDWITTIIAGEGYAELNETELRKSLPVGITIEQAIEECRKQIPNLAKGVFSGSNKNTTLPDGFPLNGSAKQNLDRLCEAARIEYRIDRGSLSIADEAGINTKNPEGDAFLLNEETGLLESPFWKQEDGTKLKKDKTRRQQVQFKALLNAQIVPASIIRIESKLINGIFKVTECRYTGQYERGDWIIEGYASEILLDDIPKD